MDNEATVYQIKAQNQARHPLTCDFYIVTCHLFDVSWDRGVRAEKQGKTDEGEREGGVLLLAHSCSHVVVERRIKQNKYYSSPELH